MKSIYIMRHGKSSWAHEDQRDHDRPLMAKGILRTEKIGKYLLSKGIKPDSLISSSAVRAFETSKLIKSALEIENDIIIVTGIYTAEVDFLMDLLYSLDNNINSVMLFGHNPTFSNFANLFLSKKVDWLPTSAVVGIHIETNEWENISISKIADEFYIYPKMLT